MPLTRSVGSRLGGMSGGGGGEFNDPSDLPNLVLWLDGADATTITESSGAVSEWRDKSTRGYHATQATSNRQPTLVAAALNGKPVIRFNGTSDYLTLAGAGDIARNVAGFTAFVVATSTKTGTQRILHINTPDTSNNTRFAIFLSSAADGVAALAAKRLDEHSAVQINGDPLSTHQIVTGWADYTNAAIELFQNGASTNTGALTNGGNTSDTASFQVLIGAVTSAANPSGAQLLEGDIAEVICYQRALTPTERGQVEAYLADKWGITLA